MHLAAQDVAGGAGNIGHNGDVLSRQPVQQAGFSGVGPARDHHGQAFAQQRALACRRRKRVEALEYGGQPLLQGPVGEKIDFLVGKVDGGFHMDAQSGDPGFQIGDAGGELALQGAHGGARRGGGAGADQIGDGFGLGDVDLAVEKGAFAESPGRAMRQPSSSRRFCTRSRTSAPP